MFHAFLIALQFLTRLPVFLSIDYGLHNRVNAIFFYPLVGLIIGGFLYISQQLLFTLAPILSAAIILTIWVMLSGALHLDGLADSADAWAGGFGDRQRSLDIMKDPRSGPIAVVVLLLYLLLKFAAILSLLQQPQTFFLLIAPVYGRASAALLLITTPYARQNGLGVEMSEKAPVFKVLVVLALSLLFLLLWISLTQWLLLLLVFLVSFYLLRRLMMKRLNGMTGDTAGAMIELVELFILLALAIWAS